MPVQVTIKDALTQGRRAFELEAAANEGLALRNYLQAKMSIGELAEELHMTVAEAKEWLEQQGISTLRPFRDPQLAASEKKHFQKFKTQFFSK